MNRDDVIRMARESKGDEIFADPEEGRALFYMDMRALERFAQLVAAQAAAEAQLDANRYRWIRANSRTGLQYSCSPGWETSHHMLSGRELDEVVDRAIRARGAA